VRTSTSPITVLNVGSVDEDEEQKAAGVRQDTPPPNIDTGGKHLGRSRHAHQLAAM
jgi:hypothetical protein